MSEPEQSETPDDLQSAMEKDFQQWMTDSLTPDRGYAFPTDNVRNLIDEKERENQRLREACNKFSNDETILRWKMERDQWKAVAQELNEAAIMVSGYVASITTGVDSGTFTRLTRAIKEFDKLNTP